MKNKKIIILGIITIFLLASGIYLFLREDRDTSLNLLERQWIDQNRNNVIDVGVLNGVPVFTSSGEGVLFDFINSLEEMTELSFNMVPFSYGSDIEVDYKFNIKNEAGTDDILFYTDNYVLITNLEKNYLDISEIVDIEIGVLNEDLSLANYYLGENNLLFRTYNTYAEMFEETEEAVDLIELDEEEILVAEEKEAKAKGFLVPKTYMLERIMSSEYNISYNIDDMKAYYVIELGETARLNSIFEKYFSNWHSENYVRKFNERFNEIYFSVNNVNEKDRADFRGKRYEYGYVEELPYDFTVGNEHFGINQTFLNKFAKRTGIDFRYIAYSSYEKLLEGFNANEVDFMIVDKENDYKMDVFETLNLYKSEFAIVSKVDQLNPVVSLNSLKDKDVVVLNNDLILNVLSESEIEYRKTDSVSDLVSRVEKEYLVLDKNVFNFYLKEHFEDFKFNFVSNDLGSRRFAIRDINENRVFYEYFNFYLSFINEQEVFNEGFSDSYNEYHQVEYLRILALLLSILVTMGLLFYVTNRSNKKKQNSKTTLTKENKLKYIDLLTSLKNRNYLNENIARWDSSGVYPQAVVVVDLNNVAYINDNYGHAEGDNVIKEAANTLIMNQEENSDIIRTSGNEFLIYMVGFDEKAIASYAKKLQKEFQSLSHGFGAAVGYSVIEDGIKTVDDAINEATIDMRNKKDL